MAHPVPPDEIVPPAEARPSRRATRRPPRAGLVGPLFRWELIRLARRGQDARARFVLAFSLLIVLTLFTFFWFPGVSFVELFGGTSQVLSLQDSARFANSFALTFLITQLAVLSLLTPAYAAGGIADEKENQTFPFLLITELTAREIVFGKFLGRLVFLLGVMFAGLPVLALTLLYGGVSFTFVLSCFLLTATTITLLSAIGVASAAYANTFRGAMFRAYGLGALHACAGCGAHPVISPFGVVIILYAMNDTDSMLMIAAVYGTIQLLFASIAVWAAVAAIRKSRATPPPKSIPDPRQVEMERRRVAPPRKLPPESPPADDPPEVVMPLPEDPDWELAKKAQGGERIVARRIRPDRTDNWGESLPAQRERHPSTISRRPAIGDGDPFRWKEWHVAPAKRDADDESIRGVQIAMGVVVGLTLGVFALIAAVAVLASGGSQESMRAVQMLLLMGGSAGTFAYLLMVGSAAGGSVCRERQRLTLESLLTIPVERQEILWPKWEVSLSKGWLWGLPSLGSVALGLFAVAPWLGLAAIPYVLAAVPFAASYGLWLSTRCRTVTRATLWFLPAAGILTLFPIWIWWGTRPDSTTFVAGLVLLVAGVGVAIVALAFYRSATNAFDREGRE